MYKDNLQLAFLQKYTLNQNNQPPGVVRDEQFHRIVPGP